MSNNAQVLEQPRKGLSFMDLPRELRDMIYEHALPPATYYNREHIVNEERRKRIIPRGPIHLYPVVRNSVTRKSRQTLPSLFLVSRQISQEAMEFHYDRALLCLDSGRDAWSQDSSWPVRIVFTDPRSFRGDTWPRNYSKCRARKLGLAITRFKHIHIIRERGYDLMKFLGHVRGILNLSASFNPDFAQTQVISLHLADILDKIPIVPRFPQTARLHSNLVNNLDNQTDFAKSLYELAANYPIHRRIGVGSFNPDPRYRYGLESDLRRCKEELVSYGFELVPFERATAGYLWPEAGDFSEGH